MKTFKTFIQEGVEPLELLKKEIDEYMAAGEIVKPKFDDLKSRLDRMVWKESDKVTDEHTAGKGRELFDNHPGLNDVLWLHPSNLHEVGAMKNKLAGSTEKTHPLHNAWQEFHNRWMPIAEKMKLLKAKIVTTAAKRQQAKDVKDAVLKKSFSDSHSLISVLTEHKAEFLKKSKEQAVQYYSRYVDILHKAGNDLDVVAPNPTYKMSTHDYRAAANHRAFYEEIQRKGLATLCDEAVERAENDFMAWVAKMTEKIGKVVVDADMSGNPWTGSTLSVTCVDGEKQKWHTQMIINQSKYQNLFNQFPSRRMS